MPNLSFLLNYEIIVDVKGSTIIEYKFKDSSSDCYGSVNNNAKENRDFLDFLG